MALAALVVCSAVACTTGPRKSEAERQADADTANRVQAALNADKELFSRHITVRADGGVVLLGGYVWTQPELEDAKRIAGLVPGVTKVVDRMEVDRSGISDSAVTR
jgi:osmotically-inducible protein OsmY